MLQRRSIIKHYEFFIYLPGPRIPDWISIKFEEKIIDPSLMLKLLPNWDKTIAGFAMSYVCIPTELKVRSITIYLGPKYKKTIDSGHWLHSCQRHHVCVRYISLDYLGKLIFGDNYKNEEYWIGGNDATFVRFEIDYEDAKMSYTQFGMHVVYKDDVKHIYNI